MGPSTLSPPQQIKIQLISALAAVASEAPSLEQDCSQIMAYYIAGIPRSTLILLQATPNFRIPTAVPKAAPVIHLSAIYIGRSKP